MTFVIDDKTFSAVMPKFQIIGEAYRSIPEGSQTETYRCALSSLIVLHAGDTLLLYRLFTMSSRLVYDKR
jgi:hypothetical protein